MNGSDAYFRDLTVLVKGCVRRPVPGTGWEPETVERVVVRAVAFALVVAASLLVGCADGGDKVARVDASNGGQVEDSVPATEAKGDLPDVVELSELPGFGGPEVPREIVEAAQRFGAEHGDHFAGLLMAQGCVWVGFTADAEAHLAELRDLVGDGGSVRAFRARFSEAELRALQAVVTREMGTLREEGAKVSMVGVSVPRNRVEVGIEDDDPAAVRLLLDRFGHDRVHVSTNVVIRRVSR